MDNPVSQPLIDDKELARLSPEKLVAGFTQTPVLRYAVIAFVLHVVLIGGTSLPFVYYTWINPEAGAARQARVEAQRRADAPPPQPQTSATKTAAQSPPSGDAPPAADSADTRSRVEQRVEEVADPDEIPSLDDLLRR